MHIIVHFFLFRLIFVFFFFGFGCHFQINSIISKRFLYFPTSMCRKMCSKWIFFMRKKRLKCWPIECQKLKSSFRQIDGVSSRSRAICIYKYRGSIKVSISIVDALLKLWSFRLIASYHRKSKCWLFQCKSWWHWFFIDSNIADAQSSKQFVKRFINDHTLIVNNNCS